jgi:septal ring factor EnvC (AmiA/AmiB activator)
MKTLEAQQKEKDRILAELKKQGKQLNNQIVAKQKQMQKVNNAITAAIKRAQKEAREEAERFAKAAAAEKEKLRREAERAAKASGSEPEPAKPKVERKAAPAPKKMESVLLNEDNVALNASFERNKGSLPWPLDRGTILMHYGQNILPSGTKMEVACVTISADIGTPVKAVFEGTVTAVQTVEDMTVVIVQHGRYFTTYSNLSGATVRKGDQVKTGQVLGKVASNFDGIGEIDFYVSNESNNVDPEKWLRRR